MIRSLTVLTVTVSAVVLAAPAQAATSDDIRTAGVSPAAARFDSAAVPSQAVIDHTEWLTDPAGPRLAVFPTPYGRTQAPASARGAAWNEVVALAPGANRQNMKDQFLCHYDFARISAPDKPSWNLEQWRPDVGYWATVAAQCNPS